MKNKKGFTLVELLVVVAIIALLLSILLPALGKARKIAKSTVCLSTVRQMSIAHASFAAEHDGSSFQHKSVPAAGGNDPENFWFGALPKYYDSGHAIPACPEAVGHRVGQWFPEGGSNNRLWGSEENSTSQSWVADFSGSYMLNSWMYNINESKWLPAGNRGPASKFFQKVTKVKFAANTPLFIDGTWCEGWPASIDKIPQAVINDNFEDPYTSGWGNVEMTRVALNRHPNVTVNATFADSSARNVTMGELWTLDWHLGFDTTTDYDPQEKKAGSGGGGRP